MTDTTMARFIAELINGGDWDDPNFYTEEQKELWRKHAEKIEGHARKRLMKLAQGSFRLADGRVVPAGIIARNGKLVCDGENEGERRMTEPTITAWRYKDHGDENWSYADGPVGVAGGADIIEPMFSAPFNGGQAYLAGYDGGMNQMWKTVRDIADGRLAVYLEKESASSPLAADTLNEHEKYRHTREAMERIVGMIDAATPKKTVNFESPNIPDTQA